MTLMKRDLVLSNLCVLDAKCDYLPTSESVEVQNFAACLVRSTEVISPTRSQRPDHRGDIRREMAFTIAFIDARLPNRDSRVST